MKQPWESKYQVVTPNGVAWSNPHLSFAEAFKSKQNADCRAANKQRCLNLQIVCTVEGVKP